MPTVPTYDSLIVDFARVLGLLTDDMSSIQANVVHIHRTLAQTPEAQATVQDVCLAADASLVRLQALQKLQRALATAVDASRALAFAKV